MILSIDFFEKIGVLRKKKRFVLAAAWIQG
jgi:hypothetical protein